MNGYVYDIISPMFGADAIDSLNTRCKRIVISLRSCVKYSPAVSRESPDDDVLAVFVPLPFLEDSVRRTLARSVLTMSSFDNEYYFIFVLVHQLQ